MRDAWSLAAGLLIVPAALGCGNSTAATTTTGSGGSSSSTTATTGAMTGGAGTGGSAACGPDPSNPMEVLAGSSDPAMGMFTMTEALAGLPEGPGPLRAIIDTDQGALTCELLDTKAPNAVANFVGLARGVRPWRDTKTHKWVKRRFYDGLLFHRVIPMFMAQGGDPRGDGTGGPGYSFADELGVMVSVPGTLAYANSGPDTNGSQFFVTEVATPWLDADFTYFGLCTPVSVVTALTSVPTSMAAATMDRPLTDEHIKSVTITRCAP
jgi:peptidyl-prolyl cis-trans isomerase A (cyclophilin A)